MSKYPPMGLESIFKFGKHKGQQVEDVLEDDPQYIAYLIEENISDFDDEVVEKLSWKHSKNFR